MKHGEILTVESYTGIVISRDLAGWRIRWREHAEKKMFGRQITHAAVLRVLQTGEVIEDYPDAFPLPAQLILGEVDERILHVVAGFDDETKTLYVITVYDPEPDKWLPGFKERRR